MKIQTVFVKGADFRRVGFAGTDAEVDVFLARRGFRPLENPVMVQGLPCIYKDRLGFYCALKVVK